MHTLAKSLSTLAFATATVAAAAPASATPTDRFVFEESGSEPGFVTCDGFAIDLSTTGRTTATVHYDNDGEWAKLLVHSFPVDTLTNTVTGKVVINRGVFTQTFDRVGETDEFTHTLVGYRYMATLPREGVVLQECRQNRVLHG